MIGLDFFLLYSGFTFFISKNVLGKSNKKNQQNMTFALGEAKRKEHA